MAYSKSNPSLLLPTFLFIISTLFFSDGFSQTLNVQSLILSQGSGDGNGNGALGGMLLSSVPSVSAETNRTVIGNTTLILAATRTNRRDPLNHFNRYTGGWNISEIHYWASVGFTAVPLFVIALVWFVIFGLSLLLISCCYCFCRREPYGYSRLAYALSLIFLVLFTIIAIIGCVFLYTGQGKFHESTTDTLGYIVDQANFTAETLKKVSVYLASAKKITVDKVFLPSDMQTKIDEIQAKINSSAVILSNRTDKNKDQIQDALDNTRLILIIVAAVMLLLTFLGFIFSVFGLQFLVYILVVIGWILVAGTFILCGVFLLLHNVVADSCVAMDQWVQNPTAYTALDDILPCVDGVTAYETLLRSKEASHQLVGVVNQVITNVSNMNVPPIAGPLYYNQSGPLIPVLCDPFNSDLSDRQCSAGEVGLNNATEVWKSFVCEASPLGICTTEGRLTPDFYTQMSAAVNVSYGLFRYGPFLVNLEDCTFVRETFLEISNDHCPGLRRYSKWTYVGLVMVSAAVMLSLIFWVIYARERRHRVYTKQFNVLSGSYNEHNGSANRDF